MASTIEQSAPDRRHANPTRDGDVFFEIDGLDTTSDGCNDSQNDSDSSDDETGDIDELGKLSETMKCIRAYQPSISFAILNIFDFFSFFFFAFADSTTNNRNGISISSASRQYTRVPKLCAAQSLPMAVPIFNQRNDKDYDEVSESILCLCTYFHTFAGNINHILVQNS